MQTKQQLYALGLSLLGVAPAALAAGPASGSNAITGFDVMTDNQGTHITLSATQPFTPDVRSVARPSATVITVPGQWRAGRAGRMTVRRNGVWTVRCGQFVNSKVRVVANSRGYLPFSSQGSSDRKRWEITLRAPGASHAAASVKPAAPVAPIAIVKPLHGSVPVSITAPATRAATVSAAPAAFLTHAFPAPAASHGPYLDLLKAPTAPPRVTPVAAAVVAHASLVAPAAAAPATQEEMGARRVSLDFVAADINDVLKALALQSGVNIVTGADVKGNITVSLKRVMLTEALDMVTRLSGFQYARFGPAYVVGTPASVSSITGGGASGEKAEEPVTEFIPFRYNSMAALGRALTDRFPGIKLPAPDKDDGPSHPKTLIVTEAPKRAAEIRAFVEKMEQVVAVPNVPEATEIYRVHYASANDLINILSRLVPTLNAQLGPAQGFVSGSSGASASYASSSPAGGGAASAGAGAAGAAGGVGGGAGTSNPAGAASSGNAPNTLLLTGSTSDIVRARNILAQIDIRSQQLSFEARVMDVNSSDIRTLGLRYDFSRVVQVGELNVPKSDVKGTLGNPGDSSPRDVGFGAILRTPYSITTNLDALENDNHARTLARPNLSALDGQPAVVFIGDQIKYVISIQQTQQGQNVQTETATVGITLKVTGKSSPDGSITLYVHPEVSSISSYLNLGNGISLPQIGTRFVDTTIRVKDGETIAIGGLIREDDVKNIQKIPFLGDIPFFGQLFRSTDNRKIRSEVVVFITSRMLKD